VALSADSAVLRLDPHRRAALSGNKRIELTAREYGLLDALVQKEGELCSKHALAQLVWGSSIARGTQLVDEYVRRLRVKLGDEVIETVGDEGYRYTEARVLVAYATKKGSTREVAEAIAARLREHGLKVETRPAAQVRDLETYDAVVIGGALYMGRWHPDARRFLRRYRKALARLPVAVFAMGPRTMEEHDVQESRQQLDRALAAVPEILPVSVAIFGGVVDPSRLRFPFSHMPASDARDWSAIRAWAAHLATALEARLSAGA